MIVLQLFLSFVQIGLFSIGGGYAAMPLIQSQAVEKYGWLTMGQFTDLVTIAEMTPGPIAVNAATFVGNRIAGIPGAIAATMGCILPSLIIVSVITFLYFRYRKMRLLQDILSGLRPVVVALIASAALKIIIQVIFSGEAAAIGNLNYVGIIIFALAFFVIRKFKKNPIMIMLCCGAAGLLTGVLMEKIN